jgi:hypothetical protein
MIAMSLPDIKELKTEIIAEIVKSFGVTKAAFFIREMLHQKTDYIEIKHHIFADKTSEEIYNEIVEWKKSAK